jgi:hypothetical protein
MFMIALSCRILVHRRTGVHFTVRFLVVSAKDDEPEGVSADGLDNPFITAVSNH